MKLFGVYLGGMVEGFNIEVHDFVFTVGTSIEDTYKSLKNVWSGLPKGLHIDSWVEISSIDGYKVNLRDTKELSNPENKIFFVNLGGYKSNHFTECHQNVFLVAKSKAEARSLARKRIDQKLDLLHVDFSYEVDDCIEASGFENVSIELTELDDNAQCDPLVINNGYFKISTK